MPDTDRIGPDYSRAYEIYGEIEDAGVLEDRREYAREDLQKSYPDETEYTIDRLYDLIQFDFTPTDEKQDSLEYQWDRMLKALKIYQKGMGCYLTPAGAQRLGEFVLDYMNAAISDCNWEGFNDAELYGVKVLLRDMAIGAESELIHGSYAEEV
jgi:hypothetical protein